MEYDETRLIRDLLQQKRAAHKQLLDRYGPMVFRLVMRIVRRQEDAEEVYQDVFVKALSNIESYGSHQATLGTWLSHIAYHEALNFVRRTSPAFVSIDDTDKNQNIFETPDFLQQKEERILQMEQAIDMLPPQEQALISMFYYDNMSLGDIAYVTDSIPSTVGSRLSRLRKKLYRIIQSL